MFFRSSSLTFFFHFLDTNMLKIILATLAFSYVVNLCYGYSGGAPIEVCDDMTPKHPDAPKKSDIPYTVVPDKKTVKPGDKVQLKISGKKPFKGFLLQVRDGDKSVGEFNVDSGHRYVKTIDCHDTKNVRSF